MTRSVEDVGEIERLGLAADDRPPAVPPDGSTRSTEAAFAEAK
ncbi:MAG TPA: hypothetical protein VFE63_03725 [Roseiarcus sp.]|jgi:hypothetical protein|nr:hypothetical protein [Roseiarcus sp.]